jgi:hypothetical protein
MLPLLLTLMHEHGQEISRLPSSSDMHGAHIRKSDDSDDACAKIGRNVTPSVVPRLVKKLKRLTARELGERTLPLVIAWRRLGDLLNGL